MAKNAITDFSTTAASNTDIGGIDIQGSSPVNVFDNALREFMSQLADTNAGTSPWADTMTIGNVSDLTRMGRFSMAGISTGTTRTYTMPDQTGVLTVLPASVVAGDIFYATSSTLLARLAIGTPGQVFQVNQAATAPLWGDLISTGSATSTTSGTSKDFTSIPVGTKRVHVLFDSVSLDGTGDILVQIGDSGGIEATSYVSASSTVTTIASAVVESTTGFIVRLASAGRELSGTMSIDLQASSSNTWVASHSVNTGSASVAHGGGVKALSGTLDRVRVTVTSGNFDGGAVNVSWE